MCVFWLIYSFQQLSEFGTIIILIYFTDKETEDQPTYKKKKKQSKVQGWESRRAGVWLRSGSFLYQDPQLLHHYSAPPSGKEPTCQLQEM